MDNFRNLDKTLYCIQRKGYLALGGDRIVGGIMWYNRREFLDLNPGLVVSVYHLTSRMGRRDTTGERDTWQL